MNIDDHSLSIHVHFENIPDLGLVDVVNNILIVTAPTALSGGFALGNNHAFMVDVGGLGRGIATLIFGRVFLGFFHQLLGTAVAIGQNVRLSESSLNRDRCTSISKIKAC